MMRNALRISVLGLFVLGACVADEPTTPGGPDSDASTEGGTGADGGDSGNFNAPPTHAAAAVAFVDVDPKVGAVGGTIRITKAADESDVSAYAIYTADASSKKSSPTPLATLTATGKNLSYHLVEGTLPQAGVTQLLVLTQNAAGEMAAGPMTALADATPHFVPISVTNGDGGVTGGAVKILFDEVARKLLIVTAYPNLLRCDLDGTGCVQSDLSAGNHANYLQMSASIDTVANKLLVVAASEDDHKPRLFRSNLDGSAPAMFDISDGQPNDSAESIATIFDPVRSKLEVATDDFASGNGVPTLFECNADGSSPTYRNLQAGTTEPSTGNDPAAGPSIVIDQANKRFIVVTYDNANHSNPSLWICPIASGNCTRSNVVGDTSVGLGETNTVLLDDSASKLDVVSTTTDSLPLLFRCDLDGSNCVKLDLTAGTTAPGTPAGSGTAVLDALDTKVALLASDGSSHKPALFRCNTDGTSCTYTDISAASAATASSISITVDPESGQLFEATTPIGGGDPVLYFMK